MGLTEIQQYLGSYEGLHTQDTQYPQSNPFAGLPFLLDVDPHAKRAVKGIILELPPAAIILFAQDEPECNGQPWIDTVSQQAPARRLVFSIIFELSSSD